MANVKVAVRVRPLNQRSVRGQEVLRLIDNCGRPGYTFCAACVRVVVFVPK